MSRKSFTLMELLVVIAIMAILAGMLLPAVMRSRTEAEKVATKLILKNIDLACREYKNDWGVYPEEDPDGQPYTINLWGKLLSGGGSHEALSYTGVLPGGGKGPYLELDDLYIINSSTNEYICDYWGMEIKYESVNWDSTAPTNNTSSFDLWSSGPDGDWTETDDDVGNWEDN